MSTYDRNTTLWSSQDGKSQPVKDLETSHVVAIIKWIKEKIESPAKYPERPPYDHDLLNLFLEERVLRFARGEG